MCVKSEVLPSFFATCVYISVASVMSDSVWPYRLQPARLLCPWDSPGKDTGVGSLFLLQGIFPTQGSNLGRWCLLHWQVDSLPLAPPGKPRNWANIDATPHKGLIDGFTSRRLPNSSNTICIRGAKKLTRYKWRRQGGNTHVFILRMLCISGMMETWIIIFLNLLLSCKIAKFWRFGGFFFF